LAATRDCNDVRVGSRRNTASPQLCMLLSQLLSQQQVGVGCRSCRHMLLHPVPPLYVMTSSGTCHIWMSAGHSRCNIHHSSGASAEAKKEDQRCLLLLCSTL
jgi:hypothetical protein